MTRIGRATVGRARVAGAAVALLAGSVLAGCSSGSPPDAATSAPVTSTALTAAPATTATATSASSSTSPLPTAPSTPSAPATATTGAPPVSTAAPRQTAQVVLRPVTASGVVVSGWSVRTSASTIDCSGGLRSPVSRSADVLFCSPSSASATACWHAADRTRAYCLPDPGSRVLVEYRLQGAAFPAARPVELPPAPASLDLVGGARCSVRDGGAAARLAVHPDWVPYYFCGAGASTAVWAAPDAADGGVTRADGVWTVQVASTCGAGPLSTAGVASAYFVGTA